MSPLNRTRRRAARSCRRRPLSPLPWLVGLASIAWAGAATAQTDPRAPAPPPAANASASAPLPTTVSTPAAHDYALPAYEILGFQFLLNRTNRYFGTGRDDYRVTTDSIRTNLKSGWGTDRDPFNVNQLGHPYQGAMYHGFARSTGFNYWESAGYAFLGSVAWEIAGERTRPSRNDQVASGIGGTFLGEALFRMSQLVLEKGGGLPPFWRELAAAAISPPTGLNRLVFGERFGSIYSSNDAAYYSRLQVGYSGTVKSDVGSSAANVQRNEFQVHYALDYGLPGSKDYPYRRPFDYFSFQATLTSSTGVESVLTHGLLVGSSYEAGPDYRGVWGVYGSYDYIAPQVFRVSTTAVSLGTTGQWWLGPKLALQGTGMLGLGYAAVGTRSSNSNDRDYNYGVAPQALLGLRLTHDDKTALDLTLREYFVSKLASGTAGGRDNIVRADASLSYRIDRQQAVALRVLGNRRDASFANGTANRQTQVTVGVFYTLLGQDQFGTVDWR